MHKYSRITFDTNTARIIEATTFESGHSDLEKDPYGDRCPVVIGSNQAIVNHSENPIYETECAFCGHHGVCRESVVIHLINILCW